MLGATSCLKGPPCIWWRMDSRERGRCGSRETKGFLKVTSENIKNPLSLHQTQKQKTKDKHTRTSCSVPLLQRELAHPPITGGNLPSTWLLPLARSMRHKLTWLFPSGTAPLYHRRRVIKSRGTEADTRLERSKSSSGLLGDASKEQRQEQGPTLGSTLNASN